MSQHATRRSATNDGGAARRADPLLLALGERVRGLRARRGLTRKAVAQAADVSERHLANLEYGIGNAVDPGPAAGGAARCSCSLAELVGDVTTSSPEWLLIRELLRAAQRRRPAPRAHRAGRAVRHAAAMPRRAAGASR